MRSYVCVSYREKYYKLVWVNEDSKGVYLGMYGFVQGTHFSYHRDGTKHFRVYNSPVPQLQHKGTPIEDIELFQQITFQVIPLHETNITITGFEYQKEDQSSSTSVFLDEEIFREKTLAIDSYLINRTKEPDFVKFLYSYPMREKYKIVACNIHELTNFPKHKIALVILSGEGVVQ